MAQSTKIDLLIACHKLSVRNEERLGEAFLKNGEKFAIEESLLSLSVQAYVEDRTLDTLGQLAFQKLGRYEITVFVVIDGHFEFRRHLLQSQKVLGGCQRCLCWNRSGGDRGCRSGSRGGGRLRRRSSLLAANQKKAQTKQFGLQPETPHMSPFVRSHSHSSWEHNCCGRF